MPTHIDYRMFESGPFCASIVEDDFDSAGAATTGAASIPVTVTFGKAPWRCNVANGAPTVSYVTTGTDKNHIGILELNTGTNSGGAAGAIRAAIGIVPFVFGTGQNITQKFLFKVPVVSDGSQTFLCRLGFLNGVVTAPTDGVFFEFGSGNFTGKTLAASASTTASGGTNVPVVADTWYTGMITWDGTTARFYIDEVFIGSSAATIPTVALGEGMSIIKSLGATARTILIDIYWCFKSWANARGA